VSRLLSIRLSLQKGPACPARGRDEYPLAVVAIENFRAARMGKDKQKKTANVAEDGAVYDDDRFVRCIVRKLDQHPRNPSSLLEHRGPLPSSTNSRRGVDRRRLRPSP